MKLDKHKVVLEAVKRLQNCPYKATAVKVEFEAHLNREYGDYDDDSTCQEAILARLKLLGLVKNGSYAYPLTYAEFYNDGSVDSEFTFTLSIKEPENIFLLPNMIEAWNDFCKEAANGEINVRGAGMHIALLNDPNGYYPSRISRANEQRFTNFKKSMELLLPSLYFLATPNGTSRSLEYRVPKIAISNEAHGHTKFNAITYKDGALEFRVFDTCYQTPEAILDDVVVIANSMKYWTNTYYNPGLSKITKGCNFGCEGSRNLERFYAEAVHIDLLNQGLRLLKPAYYTITELKQQRGFKVSKTELKNEVKHLQTEVERDYKEYEERYNWQEQAYYYTFVGQNIREIHHTRPELSTAEVEHLAEEKAKTQHYNNKKPFDQFLAEAITSRTGRRQGQYSLRAYE